jgi:hypothetical protein
MRRELVMEWGCKGLNERTDVKTGLFTFRYINRLKGNVANLHAQQYEKDSLKQLYAFLLDFK